MLAVAYAHQFVQPGFALQAVEEIGIGAACLRRPARFCHGGKMASSTGRGGEVTGVSGRGFAEPTPYGMAFWMNAAIEVTKSSLRMSSEKDNG